MSEFIPIFAVTLFLLALLVIGLMFGRSPAYRPTRDEVLELMRGLLEERTREEAWELFVGMPIVHDPELEHIRQLCVYIHEGDEKTPPARGGLGGYIYDKAGRARIAEVLKELEQLIRDTPVVQEF